MNGQYFISSQQIVKILLLLLTGIKRTHTTTGSSHGFKTYFDDFRESGEDASLLPSSSSSSSSPTPPRSPLLISSHHHFPHKIDLLECLDLRNRSIHGVEYRPGPHSPSPAAYFDSGPRGAAFISEEKCFRIGQLLQISAQEDVALMASIRQRKGNAGSLLSIVDSKNSRMFELQSSGRQDVLRLHYRSSWSSSGSIVETIPVALADDKWHKLSVSLSGDQLRVYLDCRSVFHKIIHPFKLFGSPERQSLKNLTLWVGQSSKNHFLFKGYLQNFHLVTGRNGHLVQCPNAEANCPTCGEFRNLQNIVQNLVYSHQREIMVLKQELESITSRLQQVEECECAKSCKTGRGDVHEDGSHWVENCQNCSCNRGKTHCEPVTCPKVTCEDPKPANISSGLCCAECRGCNAFDRYYDHGVSMSPEPCLTCSCANGNMICIRRNQTEDPCPVLDCPVEDQIKELGKCCSVCKADHCARGHDCHLHANCVNLNLNYTCVCHSGFQGDGRHCVDINECEQRGDSHEFPSLKGHHCHQNHSICVNTHGSYSCECEDGYDKVINKRDKSMSCRRKDVCDITPWPCHPNATCLNTSPGKFKCKCLQGFYGDGVKGCFPVCEAGCENGGTCIEPGVCSCPTGFRGLKCEEDIDECSEGFNRCGGEARCINKPGWYYCQCRSGYRTYQDPHSSGQTICIDEDECDMGSHSCHPSMTCVNVNGSYECKCDGEHPCSLDCVMEDGKELKSNGSSWYEGCNTCLCSSGKIACSPPKCDCTKEPDRGCCPECYDDRTCSHIPEKDRDDATKIPGLFRSGERWLENCKECECLHGEVDCWPLDCPPIPPDCANLVTYPGDCCPTCSLASSWSNVSSGDMCHHGGTLRKNGERWALDDECTQCDCKIPCCDQLVSSSTKLSSRTVIYIALLVLHVSLWILTPEEEQPHSYRPLPSSPTENQSTSLLRPTSSNPQLRRHHFKKRKKRNRPKVLLQSLYYYLYSSLHCFTYIRDSLSRDSTYS